MDEDSPFQGIPIPIPAPGTGPIPSPLPNIMGGMKSEGLTSYQQPSLKEKLQMRVSSLTLQLSETEEALKLLDKNPDIERIITLLSRRNLY